MNFPALQKKKFAAAYLPGRCEGYISEPAEETGEKFDSLYFENKGRSKV